MRQGDSELGQTLPQIAALAALLDPDVLHYFVSLEETLRVDKR
jgi:hypothetical protein